MTVHNRNTKEIIIRFLSVAVIVLAMCRHFLSANVHEHKHRQPTILDMFNQFIHEHTRTVIEYISIFVA